MDNKLNETFAKHLGLLKNKLNENETQTELFNFGSDKNNGVKLVDKLFEQRGQLDTLLDQIYETLINDGHSDISKMVGEKSTVVIDELNNILNTLDNRYGKK